MKKILILISTLNLLNGACFSQAFTPVATTGYNLDAVAENTTALATTGSAIDGSDYVLYSASYAAYYSGATGITNSGLIASGTRTYQLQSYTQNNMLYLTAGLTDSLNFTTPASYGALSLLAFATEGTGSMNLTVRFTDNTTQVYTGISLPDWFATGSSIISGFDRCGRNSGTPNYQTTQPKMFSVDLLINCTNRSKSVKNIKVQNSGTNARICVMAVSGDGMPSFSVTTTPVSCSGGTNGSATITPGGGLGPYSYTIASSPAQFGATPANLPVGAYSYSASDGAGCPVFGTITITQSLVTQPSLSVSASSTNICAGSTITLSAGGANTYTWSTTGNASSFTAAPANSITYTVSGITSANCLRTGSISVNVNQLPVVTLTGLPGSICVNSPTVSLTTSPPGGILTGQGLSSNIFNPSALQPGTYTISYFYTDPNNCSTVTLATITVNALPVISFSVAPSALCINAPAITLTAQPPGGLFSGNGVSGSVFTPSAAGAGSAVITYSYTDNNSCSTFSTSSIQVNPLPAVTFTLSKTAYCLNANSIPLNPTPSTGTFSGAGINGYFFNPSTAGTGTHVILYSYTNLNNCTNKAAVTVTVSDCTGLPEINEAKFSVYPNPNNGSFTIKGRCNAPIFVFSVTGQFILQTNLDEKNDFMTEVKDLPAGIYFIQTSQGLTDRYNKVIVR